MLKQSINQLPSINQNEVKFELTIDGELCQNKLNLINQFQQGQITATNLTCVDQYYYLLLIAESGIISVVETGLNNLEFEGSFSVGEQSPFYMIHQIDSLVLLSSPTKLNLSDSLYTNEEGYVSKGSKAIFQNQVKKLPDFTGLNLTAHIVEFDIQSCLKFENWSAMMKIIRDIKDVQKPFPPYVMFGSITIVPLFEKYLAVGQSAFEGSRVRLTSKDFDELLALYQTYKEDEDDKYYQLVFKKN